MRRLYFKWTETKEKKKSGAHIAQNTVSGGGRSLRLPAFFFFFFNGDKNQGAIYDGKKKKGRTFYRTRSHR